MNKSEFLLLSVGIFLTIVAWTIADVYHAYMTRQVVPKIELKNVSTNYSIDPKVINLLEERQR